MSDTFDHMCDAYDQAVNMGEGLELYDNTGDNQFRNRHYDPLWYHREHSFSEIKIQTKGENGAYLFEKENGDRFWVPKKLCRKLDEINGSVWILAKFKPKKLRKEGYENNKNVG